MEESTHGRARWIRQLFDEALSQPENIARKAYLDQACAGDAEAREEIEQLLRIHAHIEQRLRDRLPRFGAYQATGITGRGGMGLVYDARRDDGEFERRVAIKVIAAGGFADFLRDDLRRERDILARLDHPGIARLLDGGLTEQGNPYLVLEFIEGEHLDRYAAARQLDKRQRLDLFGQILDAVEYAHANGVIHRDLKPSNILVTAEGRVKLLDFGTARLVKPELTTVAMRSFTPSYASPELMNGQKVDARCDIFSLGVVYAKLLDGGARPAVVDKARAADPARRYQDVAALRKAVFSPGGKRRRVVVAAALALAAAVVGHRVLTREARAVRISPPGESWEDVSVSADGRWLAFASTRGTPGRYGVFVSKADGTAPERLGNEQANERDPSLSPDGRRVAFYSTREPAGIYEYDRRTKQVRLLIPGGHRPQYSPDGQWLLYADRDERTGPGAAGRSVWHIAPAQGGTPPRPVGGKLSVARGAHWFPDSRSLLFQGSHELLDQGTFELWRQRLDSMALEQVADWGAIPGVSTPLLCAPLADGSVLMAAQGTGAIARLAAAKGTARPRAALPPVITVPTDSHLAHCASTPAGDTYAQFVPVAAKRYVLPFDPATGAVAAVPRPVRSSFPVELLGSVSSDGTSAVFFNGSQWLVQRAGGTPAIVPGLWISGDGSTFWSTEQVGGSIRWVMTVPGRPDLRRTVVNDGVFWDVSHSGRFALGFAPRHPFPIGLIDAERAQAVPILEHPQWNLFRADLSFDEQWVAFTAVKEDGRPHNFVAPFRGEKPVPPADWVEIGPGGTPKFAPDGKRLFFRRRSGERDGIWQIELDAATKRPLAAATPAVFFEGDDTPSGLPPDSFVMSVARDGIHFSLGHRMGEIWRIR